MSRVSAGTRLRYSRWMAGGDRFSLRRLKASQPSLQERNSSEVTTGIMAATPFPGRQTEAPSHKGGSSLPPTEVDHRSELFLLLKSHPRDSLLVQQFHDNVMQPCRGHLNGMTWYQSAVEAVEPAGPQIVPGTGLDNSVIVDAIPLCLHKRIIGDLQHADRTRGRRVNLKRIPRPAPAPVGPDERVSMAFHLGESGKQLGRNDVGRMFPK